MKKIACLLSLVVMMLSIAPCCALEDHTREAKIEVGLEKQNKQKEDCCTRCSPFYACGTCSGFMALPCLSFKVPNPVIFPTSFNNTCLQSFADGVRPNIWQPPKLS